MKKLSILAIALLTVAGVSAKYAPSYGSTISLGGSTLAAPYMNAAIALYNSIFPCPTFVYLQTTPFAGSGTGRADVYNGTLNASVSDAPAPATETANLPDCFLQIPFILSSVSIIMNPPATITLSTLPGPVLTTYTVNAADIRLTAYDLCAIYTASTAGAATQWETYLAKPYNSAALSNPTPGTVATTTQITTFARSDSSGTSAIFTTWLNMCASCVGPNGPIPANTSVIFPSPAPAPSPYFPLAMREGTTPNMLAAVAATANSIGYVGTGDNLNQTAPLATALLAEAGTGTNPPASDFVSATNANVVAAQINNPSCTNLVCQAGAYPMVQAELFDVFGTQTTSWIACNISQFILFLLTQGQKLNVPGFVNMTPACLQASLVYLDSIAPAICNPCVPPCVPCASQAVCPVTCPTCQSATLS